MNTFSCYRAHKIKLLTKNSNKSAFSSAIIELVRELVISNMHNKFGKIDTFFSSYCANKGKLLTSNATRPVVDENRPQLLIIF